MPDWFYRTISQPLLFALPGELGRKIALGVMGTLARIPLGTRVIEFLGHMQPDPRVRLTRCGIEFPSPVGLGAGVDPTGYALGAFGRFGFGFLEIGPVLPDDVRRAASVERWPDQLGWWTPDPPPGLNLSAWIARLKALGKVPAPIVARIGCRPESARGDVEGLITRSVMTTVKELAPHVQVIELDTLKTAHGSGWPVEVWRETVRSAKAELQTIGTQRPVWVCLPADVPLAELLPYLEAVVPGDADGIVVDGMLRHNSGELHGTPGREIAVPIVQALRHRWPSLTIVGSGGISSPDDALRFLDAGADLLRIDTGLVYAGPGLPKRINEALVCCRPLPEAAFPGCAPQDAPLTEQSWFWSALLGAGMLFGAILAIAIAATRIVLPYDEVFSGLTREQLHAANPRLLAFLAHDRVSLAGAMLAVSIMQVFLATCGIRNGRHWSRTALLAASLAGFATFFLFLGFGYFDPFHAFVTAVLFQLLLLAWHTRLSPPAPHPAPTLGEDHVWRLSQWGQLLIILQGATIIVAGATISTIGCTSVFVAEDLEFMKTTAEALRAISPRLVPLVAHDRATFGGLLISTGISVFLTGLWGFRERAAWVWWMLFLAGTAGYAAAIAVHVVVGYTNLMHLAPAFGGLAALWLGLALSFGFLCRR